jgi:hypothetical protein
MKKILLSLALLNSVISTSVSQNEADHFFFGTYASLDFSSGSPVAGMGALNTPEGCSAVSSSAGNLLFYTNGVDVYDATGTLMPNGTGLNGDLSSSQSALIVPSANSSSQYYIFTTDADGGPDGFCYTLVDMTLNGGNGDVVVASKNVFLTDSISEKIAAVKDINGDSYWILTHKWGTNEFLAYHLTPAGLQAPVISNAGSVYSTSTFQNVFGQLKFNMCGDKVAAAVGYQDIVELFDFNHTTGVVSNAMTIPFPDHVFGVEFSKNSSLLYVTCYDISATLSQFNISLPTLPLVLASKTPLSVTDQLYGLQIGPDGKIYVARSFGTSYLGVIDSPDTPGSACNYNENGLDLDPTFMGINSGLTITGFMQTYLKSGITCSISTELADVSQLSSFSIFPSPSSSAFTMLGTHDAKLEIFDVCGRLVESINVKADQAIRLGEQYTPGIYMAVYTGEGLRLNQKFIKQ